jgi:hypothetical protein
MMLMVPPYTCTRPCIRGQRMHNHNMIEVVLIAKALTLEPKKFPPSLEFPPLNSAGERE